MFVKGTSMSMIGVSSIYRFHNTRAMNLIFIKKTRVILKKKGIVLQLNNRIELKKLFTNNTNNDIFCT